MIVIKIVVWYVAVVFCYARNIFLWKGKEYYKVLKYEFQSGP